MTDYFLGEIRAFPFTYAPADFEPCSGQILQITGNEALFSLIGTIYGGNGQNDFALPNLNNRAPMGWGSGPGLTPREPGTWGGEVQVSLLEAGLPAHNHSLSVMTSLAKERQPAGQLFAQGDGISAFGPNSGAVSTFSPGAVSDAGNGAPHNNMMPFVALNFCICVRGSFPPHQS
jgi:microcystin-dependent protein